ncbi:insulin-like growth factor-binding protein 3 receptor [Pleurodeles waltl]|uniref:insulin-like growth factor-binding protein 3 receptor n=1 Tax=Pleurodeles waltl TaxID=8319 RepID=UPI003709C086
MVTCPLGENVLACCEQRPPHVTFILCLFTLAVAFGALGAYINSNEVTDPDIRQDWNTFLQSLSDNLFCLPTNNTEDWSPDLWPIASPVLNETDNAGHPQSWVTVSLLASLTFLPTWGNREVLIHNRVRLETQIRGHKLGLTGPGAEEILNITAVPWHPQGCGGATFCLLSEITDSCITLTVPASLLPSTRKPPDCGVHPLTRTLVTPGTTARSKSDGSWKTPPCYQGKYRWQPSLTTMLTEEDGPPEGSLVAAVEPVDSEEEETAVAAKRCSKQLLRTDGIRLSEMLQNMKPEKESKKTRKWLQGTTFHTSFDNCLDETIDGKASSQISFSIGTSAATWITNTIKTSTVDMEKAFYSSKALTLAVEIDIEETERIQMGSLHSSAEISHSPSLSSLVSFSVFPPHSSQYK